MWSTRTSGLARAWPGREVDVVQALQVESCNGVILEITYPWRRTVCYRLHQLAGTIVSHQIGTRFDDGDVPQLLCQGCQPLGQL